MCTVSVLLEAHRNCESMLNTSELIVTYLGAQRRRDRLVSQKGEGDCSPVQNQPCKKTQCVLESLGLLKSPRHCVIHI